MGVFLTAGAIGVAAFVGVWSERRWPAGAANAARRALVLMLYVLLPPVIFRRYSDVSLRRHPSAARR